MAANGPAPKLNRQRRGTPVRGDWVQLEPLAAPVLPELEDLGDRDWPAPTRMYWEAWRIAPVTAKWTPDDIAMAVDTIFGHAESMVDPGFKRMGGSEIRLRMESLGLTPKGRTDRRWLLPDEAPPAEVIPLKVAEPAEARTLPDSI